MNQVTKGQGRVGQLVATSIKLAGTPLTMPVKASGAEVNTGTDDAKFLTPKAIEDSDYAKTAAIPVKASGAEVATGTNDTKFVTPKALADSSILGGGITNDAPVGVIPVTLDGDGNLAASEITDSGRTITPTDEFNLQPGDSAGNGFAVNLSGGNGANGFSGGDVTLDGGAEIGGGTSASVKAKGAQSGDGGDVVLNPGSGATSGVTRIYAHTDGPGLDRESVLDAYKWAIGIPLLQLKAAGTSLVHLLASNNKITVRNAFNNGGGEIEAQGIVASDYIQSPVVSADDFDAITASVSDTMRLTPKAFASLPGSPNWGSLACINDSDTDVWGATITGGGALTVLAFYHGSWTVFGK
jgi:hypothetical protein